MSNKKVYEFQLEQVQQRIQAGHNDPAVKQLEAKLLKLIALYDFVQPGDGDKEEEPVIPKEDSNIFKVGQKCQARCRDDGIWHEATIQSYSYERKEYTVSAKNATLTFHCAISDVRPRAVKTFDRKPKDFGKKRAVQSSRKAKPNTVASGRQGSKPTKAEHVQKREEEESLKQAGWKSFAKKMGINKER